MGSVYTEAQKKAYQKYVKSTDELRIRCRKGRKEQIKEYAQKQGMTISEFVNKIIDQAIGEWQEPTI